MSQLYVKLYPEMLMRSRSVAVFVKAVWELVAGGKQLGIAYDQASGVVFLCLSRTNHAGGGGGY